MCESIGNEAAVVRLGSPLVTSDLNGPMWRQLSDSSKSCLVCQVVRSRWRQRGTGEVGPIPVQFGPKYPVQSLSVAPGATSMGFFRAMLPVKLKLRLAAPRSNRSRLQKYLPWRCTPLARWEPVLKRVASTRPAAAPMPLDSDPLASRCIKEQ